MMEREKLEQVRSDYGTAGRAFDQAQKLLNGLSRDLRDLGVMGAHNEDDVVAALEQRYEHARAAYGKAAAQLATAARARLASGESLNELDKMVLECEAVG
jgi:mannose/cellobiose epimerase-like protein (N-acyl-D-glucosamine 2-epimerase family)